MAMPPVLDAEDLLALDDLQPYEKAMIALAHSISESLDKMADEAKRLADIHSMCCSGSSEAAQESRILLEISMNHSQLTPAQQWAMYVNWPRT